MLVVPLAESSHYKATSYKARGQWTSFPVSWLCVRRERGYPALLGSSLWTMQSTCMGQPESRVQSPVPDALDSMCTCVVLLRNGLA